MNERNIDWDERKRGLCALAESCSLCPHECGARRVGGSIGFCHASGLKVASAGPHFGEERELSGTNGSGTIFFCYCNLRCSFCQNYDISARGSGRSVTIAELAQIMLDLQRCGCHNINLVTPTMYLYEIVCALEIAHRDGLKIPVVYNCGGYESVSSLKLLDGIIDIYLPDVKYGDDEAAALYSGVDDYVAVSQAAVVEMQRQVGNLKVDAQGIAQKGLMVRHLVLPGDAANTAVVLEFIATAIGPGTYVNLMEQYYPGQAGLPPPLSRTLRRAEFDQAIATAVAAGLTNIRYFGR